GRAANRLLHRRAVDRDPLVVLQAEHVLAFDVARAGGDGEARRAHRLAGIGLAMLVAVVDDDPEPRPELFEPLDDVGDVEIVAGDANPRAGTGDPRMAQLQHGGSALEPRPR